MPPDRTWSAFPSTLEQVICCSVAGILKQEVPEIILFCGGPEATADQQRLLGEAPWDFLIHGEGESALVAVVRLLLEGKDGASAAGTATLQGGLLQSNPAAPPAELEDLPSPLLSGRSIRQSIQGCSGRYPAAAVLAAISVLTAAAAARCGAFPWSGLRQSCTGLSPTGSPRSLCSTPPSTATGSGLSESCDSSERSLPQIHFHFEVRSEFLDRQQAELFAAITCSLQIGLQSAEQLLSCRMSAEASAGLIFLQKWRCSTIAGAVFGFDLIYGLPGDTLPAFRTASTLPSDSIRTISTSSRWRCSPAPGWRRVLPNWGCTTCRSPPTLLISSPDISGRRYGQQQADLQRPAISSTAGGKLSPGF